jgi:hypothetical protein
MTSRTCMSDTCQGALDDRQRVGVEQVALEGRMQQRDELFAVLRFAHQQRGEAFEQATVPTGGRFHATRIAHLTAFAYGSG